MKHSVKLEIPGGKLLVPSDLKEQLDRVESKLDKISGGDLSFSHQIGEFVSETFAMDKLGRKKTWFYLERKAGRLKAYKSGSKIFYKMSDLIKYIEDGKE